MPADGSPENFATVVTEVSERMSVLVREELELAKAEMAEKVSSLARGAAAIAVGAVFGIFALIIGLGTLAWGLNSLLSSLWLGFLITFALLLGLTGVAFLFAWRKLKVGAPTPKMAIEANRQELGSSLEKLRVEVVRLTDWRSQLRGHQQQLTIGAGVAGFVLGGGIAALGALTFGRRRRNRG